MPVGPVNPDRLVGEGAAHPLHQRRRGSVLLAVARGIATVRASPRPSGVGLVLQPALRAKASERHRRESAPPTVGLRRGRGGDWGCSRLEAGRRRREETGARAHGRTACVGLMYTYLSVRMIPHVVTPAETSLGDGRRAVDKDVTPLGRVRAELVAAHRRRAAPSVVFPPTCAYSTPCLSVGAAAGLRVQCTPRSTLPTPL